MLLWGDAYEGKPEGRARCSQEEEVVPPHACTVWGDVGQTFLQIKQQMADMRLQLWGAGLAREGFLKIIFLRKNKFWWVKFLLTFCRIWVKIVSTLCRLPVVFESIFCQLSVVKTRPQKSVESNFCRHFFPTCVVPQTGRRHKFQVSGRWSTMCRSCRDRIKSMWRVL